jgi:uncharacterized membrane protein
MLAGMQNAAGFLPPFRRAGLLLGFTLGGFFDGILLHQVLQWHHLLSNVRSAQDLRTQLLADGLFHVLMYILALAALVLLWRGRGDLARPGAGKLLWVNALIGFGGWQFVDIVLFHWLAGIHRVRVDAPNPLFWDLLWLGIFGVVPLVAAWLLRRHGGGDGHGRSAAATLAIAALVAGPVAALPAQDTGELMVIFRPGISSTQAFNALATLDARVMWVDPSGALWAVRMVQPKDAGKLYAQGALLVSNSPLVVGCVAWTRTAM